MDERLVERLVCIYEYQLLSFLFVDTYLDWILFFFFFSFHINAIVWEKMENVKLD